MLTISSDELNLPRTNALSNSKCICTSNSCLKTCCLCLNGCKDNVKYLRSIVVELKQNLKTCCLCLI